MEPAIHRLTHVPDNPFPRDVEVASDGSVYVVDYGNQFIYKFTSEGVFATKWGTEGSGDGQCKIPYGYNEMGISVAPDGSVYVADNANSLHRLQFLSTKMAPRHKSGGFFLGRIALG